MGRKGSDIPRAMSEAADPVAAALEICRGLGDRDLAVVLVFCSPDYDLGELAAALRDRFAPVPVIGCSTAGEITPFGYRSGTVTAIGLPKGDFSCAVERLDGIAECAVDAITGLAGALMTHRETLAADTATEGNAVALLFADGLAGTEELLVSTLHDALGGIPLIGGSAGDGLSFKSTCLIHEGAAHRDAALLVLLMTNRPITTFRSKHFVHTDRKMVVTGADPMRRIVTEINAEPAGQEYARLVGLASERLSPMIFAAYPVMVRLGGEYFVRAIQKVEDDGSLKFFCAIDEGLVLTIAESVDLVQELETLLERVEEEVGGIDLVIGFDCVLRRIEIEQRQLGRRVSDILSRHGVVGFSTYGEQLGPIHLNQTFSGLAIGRGAE